MSVDGGEGAAARDGDVRPRGGRGGGRARGARARDRPRARLRHGRHDHRRVPHRRRRARDGARSASSATTRCGCPMVAVESIGAGGGSIARVDGDGRAQGGAAERGRRARARRATARAARAPTVTDANLVLGYLNPERLYGGSIRIDRGRAGARRSSRSAQRFGLSLARRRARHRGGRQREHAARAAARLGAARLRPARVRADRVRRRGPAPRGRARAAGGIARVVVPAHSGAFSALGCLVSPLRYDAVQTYRARARRAGTPKVVEDRFRALEAQCLRAARSRRAIPLDRGDASRAASTCATSDRTTRSSVPFGDGDARRAARGVRGAAPPALRLRHRRERRVREPARGGAARPAIAAVAPERRAAPSTLRRGRGRATSGDGSHRAYFPETGEVHAAALRPRRRCPPASSSPGPALIEDEWSTTIVYPGQRAAADRARQPGHRPEAAS